MCFSKAVSDNKTTAVSKSFWIVIFFTTTITFANNLYPLALFLTCQNVNFFVELWAVLSFRLRQTTTLQPGSRFVLPKNDFGLWSFDYKKTKIRLCRPGCGLRLCFARQQDHKQGGSHLNTCSRKRLWKK